VADRLPDAPALNEWRDFRRQAMDLHKILIVEDSELLHRMYDLIFITFRQNGGDIVHSYNGKEAISALTGNPDTDLILLDTNMPVMGGIEFLDYRKEHDFFQDIPTIIVSTEGKESDTLRGLEAGAIAYVTKPFRPSDLHALIRKTFQSPA